MRGLFTAFFFLPGTAASVLNLAEPRQASGAFVVLLGLFGGGLVWSVWQLTRDVAVLEEATLRMSIAWGSKTIDLRTVERVERRTWPASRSRIDNLVLHDERGTEVLCIDLHDVRDREGLVRAIQRATRT